MKKLFKNLSTETIFNNLIIGLMLIVLICLAAKDFNKINRSRTAILNQQIEYQHNELQYWKYKDSLYVAIKDYIYAIAPTSGIDALYLINMCDKYDIDIRFVMAQAQIESHFGTKGLATKTNQMFNVGAYDNVPYDKIHKDHKYENVNLSIKPYLTLLKNKYLTNSTKETDLLKNYVDRNGRRYASDVNYETKLKKVYNKINTDELYLLLENYYKYKKLCKK